MRWTAALLGAALAAASSTTDAAAQGRRGGQPDGWFTNYTAARAEAKKTGKPLLVMFH